MIKTILPHIGNKSRTTGLVLPHIRTDTEVFVEPFCGSCAVTLDLLQSRPNNFKHIICSDLNEGIIAFWRVVKKYGGEFNVYLGDYINEHYSKDLFTYSPINELEQGIFYYIKARCSYYNCINSGIDENKVFSLGGGLTELETERFEYFKELIQPVDFEVMDYKEAIEKAKGYSTSVSAFFDPSYPSKSAFSRGMYAYNFIDIVDLLERTVDLDNVVITYSDDEFCKSISSKFGFTAKVIDLKKLVAISRKELYLYK